MGTFVVESSAAELTINMFAVPNLSWAFKNPDLTESSLVTSPFKRWSLENRSASIPESWSG
jgi:hypothetical protein